MRRPPSCPPAQMKIVVLGRASSARPARGTSRARSRVTPDRQPEAGLETSFANGGQVSVSHAEPGNPTAPFEAAAVVGREDALLFRREPTSASGSGDAFSYGACRRTRRNTSCVRVASYSRDCLRNCVAIRHSLPRERKRHLHLHQRGLFEHAHREVARLQARGFDVQIKSPGECVAIEPALAHAKDRLFGGAYAATDESGDAHVFTQRLAELARERGVHFRFNVSVTGIEQDAGRVSRVVIDDEVGIEESVRADAYVVSLGSYSPLVLRGIGISLPIYPVKGYSITIPLVSGAQPDHRAPTVSITDHARKIVIARLGERLRVAGTAELAGYDTEINEVRCRALVNRCLELFPEAGNPEDAVLDRLRPRRPRTADHGRSAIPISISTPGARWAGPMACGRHALADIVSGGARRQFPLPVVGSDQHFPAGKREMLIDYRISSSAASISLRVLIVAGGGAAWLRRTTARPRSRPGQSVCRRCRNRRERRS